MISILRPLTPPFALISSAAIPAALVMDAPATADSSPMTPILIVSADCAKAPNGKSPTAQTAPARSPRRGPVWMGIIVLPEFITAERGLVRASVLVLRLDYRNDH